MEDSDDIRRLIEARLAELRLEAAAVSVELGRNRGYLHDYLRKGSPKVMPNDVKSMLARKLGVPPARLGVAPTLQDLYAAGLAESDAEPYVPGPDMPVPPPHIAQFVMRSRALDRHPRGIRPGQVLAMNLNRVEPGSLTAGTIVVAQLYDRAELTRSHGTVMRQFLPPDKLVTNSSQANDIMSLDDPTRPYIAVIKGALAYIVEEVDGHGSQVGSDTST
jgi:hypothetical protein